MEREPQFNIGDFAFYGIDHMLVVVWYVHQNFEIEILLPGNIKAVCLENELSKPTFEEAQAIALAWAKGTLA